MYSADGRFAAFAIQLTVFSNSLNAELVQMSQLHGCQPDVQRFPPRLPPRLCPMPRARVPVAQGFSGHCFGQSPQQSFSLNVLGPMEMVFQ